ncbi:MAG: SbcC/MukB-like Walker B domain-containing protein, partial [Candidatus Caldatribacteriaceae bacterium]
ELSCFKEKAKEVDACYEERVVLVRELEIFSKEESQLLQEKMKMKKEEENLYQNLQSLRETLQKVNRGREIFMEEYLQKSRAFMVGRLRKEWAESGVCPVCGTVVPCPREQEEEHIDFLAWETKYRDFEGRLAEIKAQEEYCQKRLSEVVQRIEEIARAREDHRVRIEEKEQQKKEIEKRLQAILVDLGWKEKKFDRDLWRGFLQKKEQEREQIYNQYIQWEREMYLKEEKRDNFRREEEELVRELSEEEERQKGIFQEIVRRRGEVFSFLKEKGEEPVFDAVEVFFREVFQRLNEAVYVQERELNRVLLEKRVTEEKLCGVQRRKEELKGELLACEEEAKLCREDEEKKRRAFLDELARLNWEEAYFYDFVERKKGNWQERLSEIEGSLRQVTERIVSLRREKESLIKLLGMEEPLPNLQEIVEEEENRYNQIKSQIRETENLLGRLNATLQNVSLELQEWRVLQQEIREKKKKREILEKLLSALEARNFKNYLLAVLFRKLEEEASDLLFFLSGERYALRMKSDAESAQMVVVDRRYGQEERFLHECSGGEKTLIALSLALAISRLWLRERGHRRSPGCLFIDEGFSPLDREHLELVADALLRLGKDGKMVGIVTHDQLFAEYFPLRLEVKEGKVSWKRNLEFSPIS